MRAVIVCGGDFSPELLPERREYDLWIAADSGLKALQGCGAQPDLIIGDFDSLGYVPEGAQVLPVRKDDTDLMAAVRLALARGASDFLLLGALGGRRFSHSLAAMQTLGFLAEAGAGAVLLDSRCRITVLRNGTLRFPAGRQGLISVFALSGAVRVTLEGLSYPLQDHVLTPAFPLGVSNAFTGQSAAIHAQGGSVLVVEESEH